MFKTDCYRKLDKICKAVEEERGEYECMDIHSTEEVDEAFQGELCDPETEDTIDLYLSADGRFSYEIEAAGDFVGGVLDLSKEYSDEAKLVKAAADKVIAEIDKLMA